MKAMLGAFQMMAAMSEMSHTDVSTSEEQVKDKAEYLERKKAANFERLKKKKGLSKFNYGSNKNIWALNEKNADKKAAKKGWI